jgi:arylsulfatase A-like enzyme
MKVILLVIDTLRADHLRCQGYKYDTTPSIDGLAAESVLFERAYPSDVPTQPSYTSMFTGLRGIHTGIVSHSASETLPETTPFLPELLAQGGITTASVSTLYTMRRWFARGFRYNINPAAGNRRKLQQVDAEEVNAEAIPWLERHKEEDFFLFLHYWDPHGLYLPPEEYRRLFYEGDERDPENQSLDYLKGHPIWSFTKKQFDAIGPEITDLDYIVAQYDGEIRYADDHVRELQEALEGMGIWDETAFILTSDHGEAMGENHFYFDHFGVYEPTIHVPLIMRRPDAPAGHRVNGLVQSTTSLAPTILGMFGLDVPDHMKGSDLVRLADGEEECPGEVYSNQGLWTAKRAILTGGWKLIKTTHKSFWETPDVELFKVDEDPLETRNLAEEEPDVADRLELRMSRWLRGELQGKADPLALVVSQGLPVYAWVEAVAKQIGMYETYEEWRSRVDRSETVEPRRGKREPSRGMSPPRW